MAKNKIYLVYGSNGEELSTLKTLAAAKKLADEEGGTVLCDGECVYQAEKSGLEDPIATEQESVTTEVEETVTEKETEPAKQEAASTKEPKTTTVQRFRLKTLMNIRKGPTTSSAKLGTAPALTIVEVLEVKNDWLHLKDGTFILYGAGRFAEKV